MNTFEDYLEKTEEIGYVREVKHAIAYVKGLPEAKPDEFLLFETGEQGQVISLERKYLEVLMLTKSRVLVGTRVVRTNSEIKIGLGRALLGKTVNALGFDYYTNKPISKLDEFKSVDNRPPGINVRKNIHESFEVGVTIVDLTVPLGKGQRELVVGDRKSAKTQFLMQAILSQASKGTICIYAGIAKRIFDLKKIEQFFKAKGIDRNTILVAASADDPTGLIYLAPYVAMSMAEYFRDQGLNVLVVLDDLTAHAKIYREISLVAGRFPGRSSYPGDIFYLHSRLLERAGNFSVIVKGQDGKIVRSEASITCLPVAEAVMGDLSGYMQTNLMAMTDGHIYFDKDYFNQGRRPAINPFISVTRVGRQAQTPLLRDISRQLTSFLVRLESLKQFLHFGAELSEETRNTLALGDKVIAFFEQSHDEIIPLSINILLLSFLWAGYWKSEEVNEVKQKMKQLIITYEQNEAYRNKVDNYIGNFQDFGAFVSAVKVDDSLMKI